MEKRIMKKILLLLILPLLVVAKTRAQTPPTNIALGKKVTFNHQPNYSYSTDPDDDIQLTDGKYSSENAQEVEKTRAIWVQKGTVGWVRKSPVVITIDLERTQPISGVSFSTAAGSGGVRLPSSIQMAVSDDQESWTYIGDLILMSNKNKVPPAYDDGYTEWRYVTRDLQTKGRYITFGVVAATYVFSDEIEVYRGEDAWLDQPIKGRAIDSIEKYASEMSVTSGAQWRILDDIRNIQKAVEESDLSPRQKSTFIARLQKEDDKAQEMGALPKDFRTILPINDIHRNVLSIRGELLAAQGLRPLTVWKQHRYAWLPLLATPDNETKPELNFSMLKNQFRSDSFLLTNATGKVETVRLQLKNGPRNTQDGWLEVSSVAWTDTAQGTPVADALFPVDAQNGIYAIDIPAGMTRKVWFTVDSAKLGAGAHRSTFEVKGGGQFFSIPLKIDVSSVEMKKPRLSLGMWDYIPTRHYGITEENHKEAIELMRSHFVDITWGTSKILPRPTAKDFDPKNNIVGELDFTEFDKWVNSWPDAKGYFVYLSVGKSFANAAIGTAEFDARVGSWAKALSAHMEELGLRPQQLGLLTVDEPNVTELEVMEKWNTALKKGASEIVIFTDPNPTMLFKNSTPGLVESSDIICPTLPHYRMANQTVRDYLQDLQAKGKTQWFYQCTGPARLYDPQLYHRYQAWHAFDVGATGQAFWAFGDIGDATSSFSEYGMARMSYSPVFFDKEKVYNSIHWDAVREGMEDYEELAMLKDAINDSRDTIVKKQAQEVLDKTTEAVTGVWTWGGNDWAQERIDPHLADDQLKNVRAMLEKLRP